MSTGEEQTTIKKILINGAAASFRKPLEKRKHLDEIGHRGPDLKCGGHMHCTPVVPLTLRAAAAFIVQKRLCVTLHLHEVNPIIIVTHD